MSSKVTPVLGEFDRKAAAKALPLAAFKFIAYPPALPLFDVLPAERADTTKYNALLDIELRRVEIAKAVNAHTASQSDLQGAEKAVADAQARFRDAAIDVAQGAKAKVVAWVNEVFDDLRRGRLPAKRADVKADKYDDNILYIISIPEFGLNCFKTVDPTRRKDPIQYRYDASTAFHDSLETFCQGEISTRLQEFRHLRVVFAFSCCTYGDLATPPPVTTSVGAANDTPAQFLQFSNRISILTSTAQPVFTVSKRTRSRFDGWTTLAPVTVEPSDKDANPTERPDSLFDLTCFGEDPDDKHHVVLAFATCLDVKKDLHKGSNLVVVLADAAPIQWMADSLHPFVFNDVNSWGPLALRDDYGVGHYIFSPSPPIGGVSVYSLWKDPCAATSKNCYWIKSDTTYEERPEGLLSRVKEVAVTKVNAIPPKV